MLKIFLACIFFLSDVVNKKGSVRELCMKSQLLQVSIFIMPIAYVPYFIIDNT